MSTVRCCSMLCQLHLEPSVSGLSGRGADDFNVLEPQTDLFPDSRQYETKTTGPSQAEPADLGGEQETDALVAR